MIRLLLAAFLALSLASLSKSVSPAVEKEPMLAGSVGSSGDVVSAIGDFDDDQRQLRSLLISFFVQSFAPSSVAAVCRPVGKSSNLLRDKPPLYKLNAVFLI
jgi:hypothetical protein